MRILVIEDNMDICANIESFFFGREWQMDFAHHGQTGLTQALSHSYDVIVLDIMLPGLNGIELCKLFRQQSQYLTPIIMLTARDSLDDKVKGFDAGADDYLVKPFAMRELGMRIESLSRRPIQNIEQSKTLGNILVSQHDFNVCIGSKQHTFRHFEHKILWLLVTSFPHKLTQSEILFQVWGDADLANHSLRTHIYTIRKVLKLHNASHTISHIRPNYYCLTEDLAE